MICYRFSNNSRGAECYCDVASRYAELWEDDKSGHNYYPECPGVEEHGPNWHPPAMLSVKLRQGSLPDFLWVPNSFAVRRAVLDVMVDAGITGFDPRPIVVTNKLGREKLHKVGEEYLHLFVTSVPSLNCRKSGVKLLYECKLCGAQRYSSWGGMFGRPWVIDEETYDGGDFFRLAQHDGPVYCTEKVAALVQEHRWRNVCLLDYRLVPPPTLNDLSYGMFSLTRWKFRK